MTKTTDQLIADGELHLAELKAKLKARTKADAGPLSPAENLELQAMEKAALAGELPETMELRLLKLINRTIEHHTANRRKEAAA